ncbi:MAG: complex I NDUFA9 subunit family protein [Alphaproteobacteria bacterium]|nr:complex I NDUFA9 subunit family protein [Alphaproteobacteria bacterium]
MQKKMVVFGGTGFIGRHVVQALATQGYQVIVPTRDVSAAQFLKVSGAVGQVVPLAWGGGDCASLLRGATGVVNLIGILFERGRNNFEAIHAALPRRIAQAAQAAGVRDLVHVSAIGADASSPAAYARSKARGEAGVREIFPSATILRPSVLFGAEDNFLNQFAAMARWSPFLPLIGGGYTRFQPVYVGDVVGAVLAGLNQQTAAGKTFELGGPEVLSFKEILAYILQVIGRKRCLLNLPWAVARFQASLLQLLPTPLLTVDQVRLLQTDNIVAPQALTLKSLGITPTPLALIAPAYLARYRPA